MEGVFILNKEANEERSKHHHFSRGNGPEREVSLSTGMALTESLAKSFKTHMIDLIEEALPSDLAPAETIVFPAIHGTFGEDGALQSLLEKAGFSYSGSGPESSRLCMDKHLSKEAVREAGVRVSPDLLFSDPSSVEVERTIAKLGPDLVLKPTDQEAAWLFTCEWSRGVESGSLFHWTGQLDDRAPSVWSEVTVGILGDSPLESSKSSLRAECMITRENTPPVRPSTDIRPFLLVKSRLRCGNLPLQPLTHAGVEISPGLIL